ncbi:AAA family ATPase [Maribacter polysaccharolyticus]|uniref:AAA family ATPase n=1 Tax=Maribacter polysaccharolyticus TaxID=3020831 RepID=UPI00237F401C|nr:AAA family ATPase [Maribacter polysaccharolyticus]MDE3740532.1 AAA family ATPase [Maribacter polysaccharolyticus]
MNWQGGRPESDLNAVSVFNSDCVNISLSNTRELLVTPKGFYLFTLVTNELTELAHLLNAQYALYPIVLSWKDQMHESTPQKVYIDALVYNSNKATLNELSLFNEEHQTELIKKEQELENLNKSTLEARLKSINLMLTEITSKIVTVKQTQSNLTKNDWDTIIQYNATLKALKAKTQLGIAGLAEVYGLEQFDADEFSNFLKSADAYIKLLAKENYPNNADDTCIYCKQDLQNQKARNLVENYGKILNDNTEAEIKKYEKLKSDIVERVNLVTDTIKFHQPTFGILEDGNILQPQEVLHFNTRVTLFKNHIMNNTVDANLIFDINYIAVVQFLEAKQIELTASRDALIKALNNLLPTETKLKAEIAELKDRKLLSEHKQEVLTVITNLLSRKIIDDNRNQFNTNSLSVKTTQARQELVAQDFQDKFTAELTGFRKQHLGVSLSFFSQQGSSRIRQNVANQDINKVLSEGEQKTIALCEFLTELQLDTTVAPVVFDDPVNSLDHLIIQDVAKRLVDLSKERQVIVFTHNVIFFNAFFGWQVHTLYKNNTDFKFYQVKSTTEQTGLLSDGAPINRLSTYRGKVSTICNNGIGDRDENEVVVDGYDFLRTTLELLVSKKIFQDVVDRYRPNLKMTLFPAIKGHKIEEHKAEIDSIFGRASGYIRAHSHPEEHYAPPTLNDLKSDFERFKVIEADFN